MAKMEFAPIYKPAEMVEKLREGQNAARVFALAARQQGYPSWRYVKYHAPAGVDAKLYWNCLQVIRGLRPIPSLKMVGGGDFSFSSPSSLQQKLHEVDCALGFSLETDAPFNGLDPDLRRTYIQRSLTEEAISSSLMEGAVTTREVAREMLMKGNRPADPSQQMILNNYLTMERLGEWKNRELSFDLLNDIHSQMTEHLVPEEKRGRIREAGDPPVQVDDGVSVYHLGTDAKDLPSRLESLFEFANRKETDDSFLHPIVKAAIIHFMIGYEHPFADGNGRTARSLFYWYMLRNGYWIMAFLSISSLLHMPRWRKLYNEAYTDVEYGGGDLTYFALMQADVLREASREFHAYVDQRQKGSKELHAALRTILSERQIAIVDHITRHPGYVYTAAEHAKWHGISLNTARSDLDGLRLKGFLIEKTEGRLKTYTSARQS